MLWSRYKIAAVVVVVVTLHPARKGHQFIKNVNGSSLRSSFLLHVNFLSGVTRF